MDNSINPNERRVYREREVVQYDANGAPIQAPANYVDPSPVVDARATHADYGDARVDNYRKAYVDEYGNVMEREEQVVDDSYTRRLNVLDRTKQIIYFLTGALELLLALRFIFRALGADPNNGIVNFIYNLSNPFVIAFNGIFSDQRITTNSILEISTLLAMALYAILAWIVIAALNAFLTPNPSSRQVFTKTRRRQ